MKFLCPHCDRLAEVESVLLESSGAHLVCGKCAAKTRVDAPVMRGGAAAATAAAEGELQAPEPAKAVTMESATAAPIRAKVVPLKLVGSPAAPQPGGEDPFTAPEGTCPKCIAERAVDAQACPHCGLVFVNFSPESVAPSNELKSSWRKTLDDWSNEEVHQAFRAHALRNGELVAAGRLYRIFLARHPGDLLAERGRREIIGLASMPQAYGATEPTGPSPVLGLRIRQVAFGLAALLFIVCLMVLVRALLST